MNPQNLTVLIVEDLEANRELYRRALRQDSSCVYDLLEVESVAAGLALCQTRPIDAVLLDDRLPDGDGLDFLERLLAQNNGSIPPVVMVSEYGNERIAVRAIKLGAEDYLVKSDLTAELLLATLRSAILQGRGYANENTRLRSQLRQYEDRFGTAIENMFDCFGICSAIRDRAGQIVDFRFDYQNAAAMQSNRMTEADMDRTICEVFPALRETGLFVGYCQVVETGIPLVTEDLVYSDVFGGEQLTRAYNVHTAKLDDGFMATWRDITAQKQVELSLKTANQQITTIWESMTDAYVTLDRDWRFTYANSTATQAINQLLESPTEEIMGEIYWEVFPWTVGTIAEQEYPRAVAEGVAAHFDLFYEPAETWFEIHAYPSTEGLGIYFRDVNERRRTELARRDAEAERDRFFDVSIDLLVVANHDEYFVRVNPASEQMLGFTSAEMMAQPFLDFVHPEDRAATRAIYKDLTAGNVLVNFENRYRCKDGSYRWILWSAIPDVERQLICASGHDITERKRDEELLRQSEELTRRILESNRDCIKVVDLAGRLIYMNDYGQSLMEIDDFSTVAESQWLEFWQDSDSPGERLRQRESARTAFSIALAGGVHRFDGYCATNKGTPKWWEVIVTPILAADGQVSQILSVSHDITDRKIAELNDGFLYELTQRLRHLTDPEAIQWEAIKSLGEYLNVDRATWFEVNLERGLATVSRDWDRNGVGSMIGEYSIDEFASPTFQVALLAGKPIAISDVIADPLTAAYSDNYQQVGIRAFASIPCLDDEGRWVMTLHLNTAQNVRIWRDDEIQLLQTLVTQLWSFVAEARAVEALRAQEQQTRAAQAIIGQQLDEIESIYQMAPVGLCFVDTDFRYVRINEQLALINGVSVAEHIGQTFREVLPELASTMEPVYRQVMESGEPIIDLEVTGTNRAQPGVERWWLASFYPQTDDRGHVIGINNVVQEITDRKRLEAARLAAEQERDRFFERSIDLLAIGNFEGYFVRINPAFERLLGFTEAEFVSRPFIDFVHPDDRASTLAVAQGLANGQSVVDFENRCQCQDGSIVWVSWNATPYQQSSCWYSVGRDITDRKRTDAALWASEQMRRFMFEQTFEMIGLVDLDGVLLEVNQAALDSISAQSSEIVGRKFWEAPWWTHSPQLQQQLIDAIDRAARGEVIRYEAQFPDGNGNVMTTDFSLKPMFDEDGRIVRLIAEGRDITERKQAQADLEERNRELDSFVYVVSHDLKAPLRAVANLSQWIEDDLDGQLTDDTQSQMNLLRSRVNRMAGTIDGLLEYARVGRDEDASESVAVARLLAEVIDSVAPPPTFTIDLPTELPTLITKRLPLFQVFVNLIGNGIKHHHSEAGKIQIAIAERGDWYEFAIADDGSGIAPEHHDRMFKIFQAVNPQKRSDSTGIGLAITSGRLRQRQKNH